MELEKSSKSMDKVHQDEVFKRATSSRAIHPIFLSWNILWFCPNQISASIALTALAQINLGPFFRASPTKICLTLSQKGSLNTQLTLDNERINSTSNPQHKNIERINVANPLLLLHKKDNRWRKTMRRELPSHSQRTV